MDEGMLLTRFPLCDGYLLYIRGGGGGGGLSGLITIQRTSRFGV